MGETEEDGAKPLRQPKKDGSQKPIRQAENEIPVFALFAILANMDPRTASELIAKKKGITASVEGLGEIDDSGTFLQMPHFEEVLAGADIAPEVSRLA